MSSAAGMARSVSLPQEALGHPVDELPLTFGGARLPHVGGSASTELSSTHGHAGADGTDRWCRRRRLLVTSTDARCMALERLDVGSQESALPIFVQAFIDRICPTLPIEVA